MQLSARQLHERDSRWGGVGSGGEEGGGGGGRKEEEGAMVGGGDVVGACVSHVLFGWPQVGCQVPF